MARIKAGWQLTKKSWGVLRSEKTLLLFPILSLLASLAALLALTIPVAGIVALLGSEIVNNEIIYYLGLLLFLLLTTFITVFFNVALTSQVAEAFAGREVSIKAGLAVAWGRKGIIFRWSLLAAVVGTILRIIAERLPFGGALLSFIGGVAWGVASWFVVPIITLRHLGPVEALKASTETVKQRWGEGVTGMVAIGGVALIACFILIIAGFVGAGLLISSGAEALALAWGLFCFLALMVLLLLVAAMRQIFDLAVYLSISSNQQPVAVGPFSAEDINLAAASKS